MGIIIEKKRKSQKGNSRRKNIESKWLIS